MERHVVCNPMGGEEYAFFPCHAVVTKILLIDRLVNQVIYCAQGFSSKVQFFLFVHLNNLETALPVWYLKIIRNKTEKSFSPIGCRINDNLMSD